MFRWHVVSAVFWRNVKQYFSGVLGYLFIVVFVTICAVMAFSPRFFADNLANLDQLSRWFPMLLLFFVPAITMSTWADERRQGTDSILFTLPASDFDILMGKYLAVAAVYTVALLFSMTQLIVLQLIGNPDWGVILTTYAGYWLAGVSLLAVGMFASSLTSSATVAFVLGALLCAIPVLIGHYFRGFVWLERLGFDWNLRDFTIGLIPLSSVLYFVSLTIVMLYLNLIVISHRHWNRGQQSTLATQFAVRALSLAVGLVAFNYFCGNAISSTWSRADLTSEKLYTLNSTTVETLEKARELNREITIQAFISEDVPRKFVPARKQFVGLLRQYDDYGGPNIDVRYVNVKPNSQNEIDAQYLGITPVDDRSDVGGRTIEQEVYLGANISSAAGEVTLPFVGEDASIEYELSRSIATVLDKSQQLTVGILETDAKFAGPEFNERRIDWAYTSTMEELDKQFEIEFIRPEALEDMLPGKDETTDSEDSADGTDGSEKQPAKKLKPAPDVLIVADPASLSQPGLDVLVRYIEAGNPAVILADPVPFFWTYQNPTRLGIINAPRMPRVPQQSPAADFLVSSPLPKADQGRATQLLDALGIEWDNGQAVWSTFNPHPAFKGHWPEYMGDRWPEYYGDVDKAYVYVRNHGDTVAFNPDDSMSSELSELLMFYPGSVAARENSDMQFTPLASIGTDSGTTPWESLTLTPEQETRYIDPRTGRMTTEKEPARSDITMGDLIVLEPQPATFFDEQNHVVAARIQGKSDSPVDVVFIADLDFVSDLYLDQEEAIGTTLDNLAFLQNAIEVLAGNEDFVKLRNRKIKPRTLVKLESVIEDYRAARTLQQSAAEKEIRDELDAEQKKLNEAAEKIDEDQSLSFFEKLQKTSQEASDAQRRFDLRKKKLDRQLEQEITRLETEEQKKVSRLENVVRYASIFAAPLPAFLLGAWVLLSRQKNEEKNIAPERRVSDSKST